MSVSRRGCVYHGPSNGSTSATRPSRSSVSHQVGLAAVEVDRALVRRSRGARSYSSVAEQRAGRSLDDGDRSRPSRSAGRRGRRGSARRARPGRRACAAARRPRPAPRPRVSAPSPSTSSSAGVSGSSCAAARRWPRRISRLVGSRMAASTRRPSSASGWRDEELVEPVLGRARSTASPSPRRPARPHCWRRLATVPGKPVAMRAVEQPDVDAELERVRGDDAEQARPRRGRPRCARRSSAV